VSIAGILLDVIDGMSFGAKCAFLVLGVIGLINLVRFNLFMMARPSIP
jgi:hypothetical protein